MAEPQIEAVLIDLDDTIFPQSEWLLRAWRHVALAAGGQGVDAARLYRALQTVAAEGSDRGRIIDRALEKIDAVDIAVGPLVDAFRAFRTGPLAPYPGARDAIRRLAGCVRTAIVTDGDPAVQRSKIRSLGVDELVDLVVISDEFGREHRKPDPYALLFAAAKLGVEPYRCVYIGDRPDKDVAAANAAGMRSIRVVIGEYEWAPDVPPAWMRVPDLPAAVDAIGPLLSRATAATEDPVRPTAGR